MHMYMHTYFGDSKTIVREVEATNASNGVASPYGSMTRYVAEKLTQLCG